VVIDATGKPGVAADFDLMAMEHGKHLVMMNVEADVTIGPYLKHRPTGWASSIRSAPATSRAPAWS
jgi:predicted homoserine dehydrogenase-like protein